MDPDPQSEIGFAEDGDAGVPSSTLVVSIPPNPARKPTRQWAAWTRQEEENFFNALRQVGKNFEKITCRVQSKNKDQVRHYYYRLVRRMNKLLGPGFGLDAKNSKDTIAAMLRWWSLLEKYSCTASKLHLKPRRFKTFVESLAHQLLKDRNKTRRKRPSHGENFSSVVTTPIPGSGPLNDAYPVKVFLLDGQITQKLGSGKGIPCFNANDSYNKVSSSTVKTVKHKRRASLVASAAYKRWEKAAIAGVSLVADAAEKLEHSVADVTTSFDKVTCNVVSHNQGAAQKSSSPAMPSVNFKDTCCYQNKDTWHFKKLKLQLFPIDDCTRRALEKNDHNPYLELTLSSRKRISSILGHLKHKWENSGLASGELTLLPYGTQHEDLVNCQKWTQKDTVVCAADIYATVGSPSIFRLRYGWFSNLESDSGSVLVPMSPVCVNSSMQSKDSLKENSAGYVYNKEASQSQIKEPVLGIAETVAMHLTNMPERMIMDNLQDSMNLTMNSSQHIAYSSSHTEGSCKDQHDEQDHLSLSSPVVSASEWADSLTNISIGDLLSEASRAGESIHVEPVEEANVSSLQQATVSSDSFDAAVAAHINDNNQGILSSGNSIASIWDAEDTCDGFAFRKIPSQCRVDSGPNSPSRTSRGGYRSFTNADSNSLWGLLKSTEIEHSDSTSCDRELNADLQPNEERASPNKHGSECSLGLTDLYWPDSLGVLDLGVHSGCLGEDNIFGESISLGLSCLIASSLDAFQNCPFFSIDRRESSSEAQEASMLSKHKVGTDG